MMILFKFHVKSGKSYRSIRHIFNSQTIVFLYPYNADTNRDIHVQTKDHFWFKGLNGSMVRVLKVPSINYR